MKKREAFPLQKVTLNLFEGDFDWLRENNGRLGAGKVIRELVRAHRNRVENRLGPIPVPDIDIDPKEILNDGEA